jgi:glycosyltransferase involved in cell wall biosynthesis
MHIFGAGELENEMKAAIIKHELAANVIMGGVLNFESELIPRISKECDLFVCCHRQGDPSCTYIETLCCGVPIVGYSNEAFSGIMKCSEIGYEVPINNFKALAKIIACLDSDRGRLISLSYNSVDFAKKHLFEENFTRRIAQLTRIAKVN